MRDTLKIIFLSHENFIGFIYYLTVAIFMLVLIAMVIKELLLWLFKPKKRRYYVLVSQGIEIYRTTNRDEAKRMMTEMNEEWYDYCQQCYDKGEIPADNEVFMYEEDN